MEKEERGSGKGEGGKEERRRRKENPSYFLTES